MRAAEREGKTCPLCTRQRAVPSSQPTLYPGLHTAKDFYIVIDQAPLTHVPLQLGSLRIHAPYPHSPACNRVLVIDFCNYSLADAKCRFTSPKVGRLLLDSHLGSSRLRLLAQVRKSVSLGQKQTVDVRQAQVARRREKMATRSQSSSRVCPSGDLYSGLSDITQRLTGPLTIWSRVENITSQETDVTRCQS